MRAVIFANGLLENVERALEAAENAELIIAANGGSLHCLRLGIEPALVVGDLDSLDAAAQQTLKAGATEFIAHPPDKDQTDLELALVTAVALNATKIVVLGATGGRLDMTLANVHLLALPELGSIQAEMWRGDQTAVLLRPPGGSISGEIGDGISLIPIGGGARSIATNDLQYALDGEDLDLGPARGVSNVVNGPDPQVELENGLLLIVHTPEPQSNA